MPRQSKGVTPLSPRVEEHLRRIGENIQVARKRRRYTMRKLADMARVSVPTIRRLERGDPGVSIGLVANVLWLLQLDDMLALLADPANDALGMSLDKARLPRAIRGRKGEHMETGDELDF